MKQTFHSPGFLSYSAFGWDFMVWCQLNADVRVGAGVCLFFRSVFMFDYWLGEKRRKWNKRTMEQDSESAFFLDSDLDWGCDTERHQFDHVESFSSDGQSTCLLKNYKNTRFHVFKNCFNLVLDYLSFHWPWRVGTEGCGAIGRTRTWRRWTWITTKKGLGGKTTSCDSCFCLRDCLKMAADELTRSFVGKILSDTFSDLDNLKMGDVNKRQRSDHEHRQISTEGFSLLDLNDCIP